MLSLTLRRIPSVARSRVPSIFYGQQIRQMSFFNNLVDRLKGTAARDKELMEKLEKLQKEAQNLGNTEGAKFAKETFEKAKTESAKASEGFTEKIKGAFQSFTESDLAKKAKEELGKLSKEGKKFTDKTGEFSEKMDEAASQTPFVKEVKEFLQRTSEPSPQYGGFRQAEERRREKNRREHLYKEMMKRKEGETTAENPDAGSGIVLHKDSVWKERWNSFKEGNPLMQKLFSWKKEYEESDNMLVHQLHRIQDAITGIFSESEHALVLKQIKVLDPNFDIEELMKEMHDYIIPEVIESFLHGNRKELKSWCSEGAYSVLNASIEEREKAGLHVDSKILELKNVDLAMAKIIDEKPVLIFTFNTHQVTVIRDRLGKIVEGKEDDIESVHYVVALTKDLEFNPITGGWKIMEMGIQATMKIW